MFIICFFIFLGFRKYYLIGNYHPIGVDTITVKDGLKYLQQEMYKLFPEIKKNDQIKVISAGSKFVSNYYLKVLCEIGSLKLYIVLAFSGGEKKIIQIFPLKEQYETGKGDIWIDNNDYDKEHVYEVIERAQKKYKIQNKIRSIICARKMYIFDDFYILHVIYRDSRNSLFSIEAKIRPNDEFHIKSFNEVD